MPPLPFSTYEKDMHTTALHEAWTQSKNASIALRLWAAQCVQHAQFVADRVHSKLPKSNNGALPGSYVMRFMNLIRSGRARHLVNDRLDVKATVQVLFDGSLVQCLLRHDDIATALMARSTALVGTMPRGYGASIRGIDI
jgi:hypothetical protein